MIIFCRFSRSAAPTVAYSFRTFTTARSKMEQLKVHNSLKPGAPVPFVPKEEGKVSWYVCGPTVYDHSHLGHARNYVSTDIIRRIMRDYFGYKINFVMNITDVDDKVCLPVAEIVSIMLTSADYIESAQTKITRAGERKDIFRIRPFQPCSDSFSSICREEPPSAVEQWKRAEPK